MVGRLHFTSLYHCASSKTSLSPNKNSNACIQLSRLCRPSPKCLESHPGEGGELYDVTDSLAPLPLSLEAQTVIFPGDRDL